MTATSKWSRISESLTVIWIGVHLAGEEPDQYVVHLVSRVSRTTTVHGVPTKSKLGPCSQDDVLAPNDRLAQLSSWAASFSLQQTTSKQGGMIWQSSYLAARFIGPINPTCIQYKSKLIHRGQNNTVLNRHRRGLPLWNLIISATLFPTLPLRVIQFPLFALPGHNNIHEHKRNLYSLYPR
jgi:hypothetical protein